MSLLNRFLAPFATALVVAAGVTFPSAFSVAGEYFEKGGVALHGYLNYNRDIQKQWAADIPGFVAKADAAWPAAAKLTKVHE